MAIGNNEDHEIEENSEDHEILDENNEDHEIEENSEDHEIVDKNNESMKRDEALNRKLNFGNSESCRVMHKLIIVEIFV